MCTASWMVEGNVLRFFFNRDERRTRGAGIAPAEQAADGVRYLAPIDSVKGGTWIAASDRGALLAIMNRSDGLRPSNPGTRGRLIPKLVGARRAEGLSRWLGEEDLSDLPPFSLLSFGYRDGDDRRADAMFTWDGRSLDRHELVDDVGMVASSGLGDAMVSLARLEAFRYLRLRGTRWTPEVHREFHRSHVPMRGPLSPCMHHELGSTVSFTEVEITPTEIVMRYLDGSPCQAEEGEAVEVKIERSS